MSGEGDDEGGAIDLAEELLEVVCVDGVGVEDGEDAVGVGELFVGWEGDGVKARGDVPA